MPSRKKPSQEDARGKRKTQPPVSQIAKTRDKKCVSALSENLAGLRASRKKTKEQKIKDLEKEKKRILKLLRENEVQLKEVRERTDADEEGKSSCKKASKSRSQHDALPEHQMNLGLFDALADLWNFVFESLPSRSLIILSMVSSQGKAAVDAAHMNLW
jgi:flagellar motor switch protein FliG